jgi:hypothetical protein
MTASPANVIRKSFGSIMSKISNRTSIDGPEDTKQVKFNNIPCFACGVKGKKNIQCRPCQKVACILHSSTTSIGNPERVCDECVRSQLIVELSSSDEIKDKISIDIQDTISKRDDLTKLLNRQNTKVRNLQNEAKETKERVENEKNNLVNQLMLLQKENKIMENECNDWESQVKVNTENKERADGNLERAVEESQHLKINVDEMIKERTILLSNLNELRDFIRLQVPVRIIKKIVCSKCYISVQNAFAANFKNVAPVKVEQVSKKAPQKKGACASCFIF